MNIVPLAVIATIPLIVVTAILGSAGISTEGRPGAEQTASLRRAVRDLLFSGVPKERIAHLAAAELRWITTTKGVK